MDPQVLLDNAAELGDGASPTLSPEDRVREALDEVRRIAVVDAFNHSRHLETALCRLFGVTSLDGVTVGNGATPGSPSSSPSGVTVVHDRMESLEESVKSLSRTIEQLKGAIAEVKTPSQAAASPVSTRSSLHDVRFEKQPQVRAPKVEELLANTTTRSDDVEELMDHYLALRNSKISPRPSIPSALFSDAPSSAPIDYLGQAFTTPTSATEKAANGEGVPPAVPVVKQTFKPLPQLSGSPFQLKTVAPVGRAPSTELARLMQSGVPIDLDEEPVIIQTIVADDMYDRWSVEELRVRDYELGLVLSTSVVAPPIFVDNRLSWAGRKALHGFSKETSPPRIPTTIAEARSEAHAALVKAAPAKVPGRRADEVVMTDAAPPPPPTGDTSGDSPVDFLANGFAATSLPSTDFSGYAPTSNGHLPEPPQSAPVTIAKAREEMAFPSYIPTEEPTEWEKLKRRHATMGTVKRENRTEEDLTRSQSVRFGGDGASPPFQTLRTTDAVDQALDKGKEHAVEEPLRASATTGGPQYRLADQPKQPTVSAAPATISRPQYRMVEAPKPLQREKTKKDKYKWVIYDHRAQPGAAGGLSGGASTVSLNNASTSGAPLARGNSVASVNSPPSTSKYAHLPSPASFVQNG